MTSTEVVGLDLRAVLLIRAASELIGIYNVPSCRVKLNHIKAQIQVIEAFLDDAELEAQPLSARDVSHTK